jgi:hypothetical protein
MEMGGGAFIAPRAAIRFTIDSMPPIAFVELEW